MGCKAETCSLAHSGLLVQSHCAACSLGKGASAAHQVLWRAIQGPSPCLLLLLLLHADCTILGSQMYLCRQVCCL